MSLFGKIMSSIFGAPATAAPATGAPAGASPAAGSASTSAAAPGSVDVSAIMADLAEKNPEKLDWKKSIVDLMKLVDIDSSLANRRELAKELGYTGSTTDTAEMNIWLHKQVLTKIAANGGKVPKELLD